MTDKELEKLEKNSLYTMKVSPDIKDQVVSGYLNELYRVVKKEVKRKKVLIMIIEIY